MLFWPLAFMIYLVSLFLIAFTVLAARRLEWALMLLIFLLPSYLVRFKVGVPMTLLEAMILIVAAVWVWQNRTQLIQGMKRSYKLGTDDKRRVAYPFGIEIVLLLLVSLFAVGISGFGSQAFGIWKAYFFEPALLYLVALNVIGKSVRPLPKQLAMVIWPLALSALTVALFAVYQKFTGHFIANPLWAAPATRRVVSVFGYPNAVGLYVESIIFLALGFLLFARQCEGSNAACRRNRLALALTIALSLFAIIFAKSVGASLGVAAGFIVFALLYGRRSRIATLAILAIAAIAIAGYQPLRQRVAKYATLNDFSGQVRKAQWRETWTMLKDDKRWFIGAGLDNYQTAIAPYHQPGIFVKDFDDPDAQRKLVFNEAYRTAHWQPLEIYKYPHNIILNFWAELGLLGLALFVWLIGKFFYFGFTALKSASGVRPQVLGLVAAMAAVIVHGLVDVPYFKNDLAAMFWLLLALLSLVRLQQTINKA